MKRRAFLKRAVVVVAGATVVPAVVKAKTKPKGKTRAPTEKEMEPEYSLGTRRVDACGRVFRLIKERTVYICHACGWKSSVERTKPGEFLCNECLKVWEGGKFYSR